MLVLAREVNGKVVITVGGREVVVTVCAVRGNRVKIGIEADRDVGIRRDEVAERKAG
jgi:carbon storage regulator CsrA